MEVVIVDDEEQITDLLETAVKISSVASHVRTFNDSMQARDYMQENMVDLLITDYKMPKYNGLQLMESAPPAVKKILISGYVSEVAEEKLQKLNAVFFEKPVPLRAISKIINDQAALIPE